MDGTSAPVAAAPVSAGLVSTPAIVVGVDGSPASRAALELALREGALRASAVAVVTVWAWEGVYAPLGAPDSPQEARERARRMQDVVVAEALAAVPAAPVVSRQVVEGDAAHVLLQAARNADCMFVGSGHKNVVQRALIGSVSEFCVRHATCPVVVVPAPSRRGSRHERPVEEPVVVGGEGHVGA